MKKKKNNSFGAGTSFGKFKGSVFNGSTPKVETYKVQPIEGAFGGSIPNSLYTVDRESTWSRWRRGYELGAANLTNTAYEYPFEYILNTIQIFLPYTLRRAMVIGPNGRNYNPDAFTQRQYDLFANMTRRGLQAMADWNTIDGLKEHLERGRPPTVEEVRKCIPKHLWKTVAL